MAKILIVDDAAFMRMMIKDILTKNGYEVVAEAANGVEAVELYKSHQPDLVTMDITMPEMDGIEAVKQIKAVNPAAKVIMCSAMGQQSMVMDAIKAGANDFIVKPFQADRVLEDSRIIFYSGGVAMQFIIFRLGSEYFATETEKIQNISDIMQITKVPTAPSYIKGLINLRGSIKPLVDIGMLLNIKNQSENQNIIILKLDEEEVGIAVDEVIEVADIDLNMLQNTSIDSKEYIKGVIEFNKYLLTVIDINKIVNI